MGSDIYARHQIAWADVSIKHTYLALKSEVGKVRACVYRTCACAVSGLVSAADKAERVSFDL